MGDVIFHILLILAGVVLATVLLSIGRSPLEDRTPRATISISDAARSGDTAGIQQAVAAGASLDAVDRLGDTALHHAYRADRPESVQCLLELGAKAGIKNRAGLVPSDLVDLSRVEALVLDGRSCLSMSGRQWIDEAKGREIKKKLCTQPHLYRAAVMYLASSERPPWSIITFSIAVGIPGSESILTDLLYLLDDSVTAQILANSGSSDLRSAAGAWAAARGMMMVQKDGPGTVTWGCV